MHLKNKSQIAIEEKTAELFPRIHSHNSIKDIRYYNVNTSKIIKKYLARIEKPFALKNKISLEVGCGGRCAGLYMLRKFRLKKMYAIDLSSANIKTTQRLLNKFKILNCKLSQGNALELAFKKNAFDFVMSDGVIHHTLDTKKAFDEICRVTKRDGFIFLGIYGYGGLFGLLFPLGVLIGKILPYKIMYPLITKTNFLRSQEYSILDWLYTPIQRNFKSKIIEKWLQEANFHHIEKLQSNKWFFKMGIISKILFGDGYLYFMAIKK